MNNQNPFAPAVRAKSKLRLAINGVAGSGKTYTALKVASNMVTPGRRDNGQARIAMIDSERGSARLYAGVDGLQPFDVLELQANSGGVIMPELYLDAIRMAEQYGYEFLIIDSLSHAWEGVLEVKAQLDKKPGSNSYTNWRDVTPLHNRLVDSILSYNGHVIACMRVKMEHVVEKDDRGKNIVRKVGLKSVMRDGVEYEFSVVMDMSDDNSGAITKTRCMELTGQIIAKPGVDLAYTLNQWLETGVQVEYVQIRPTFADNNQLLSKMLVYANDQGFDEDDLLKVLNLPDFEALLALPCDDTGRAEIKAAIASFKAQAVPS